MSRKKPDENIMGIKQKAIKKLISLCGSQRKLACVFSISQQSILSWVKYGVPITRRQKIIEIFGNQVKDSELWPEIFVDENN